MKRMLLGVSMVVLLGCAQASGLPATVDATPEAPTPVTHIDGPAPEPPVKPTPRTHIDGPGPAAEPDVPREWGPDILPQTT